MEPAIPTAAQAELAVGARSKAELKTRLECSLLSPSQARGCLDQLSPFVRSDEIDDIKLLVSELITNSVRHAHLESPSKVCLGVKVDSNKVRVEVSNPGTPFDIKPPERVPLPESGLGLFLVATISDRWGWDFVEGKTTVWFELDTAR